MEYNFSAGYWTDDSFCDEFLGPSRHRRPYSGGPLSGRFSGDRDSNTNDQGYESAEHGIWQNRTRRRYADGDLRYTQCLDDHWEDGDVPAECDGGESISSRRRRNLPDLRTGSQARYRRRKARSYRNERYPPNESSDLDFGSLNGDGDYDPGPEV